MSKEKVVALLGATGATGQLILSLGNSLGWTMNVLVRHKEQVAKMESLATRVVVGDATDQESLQDVVRGAHVVVNALGPKSNSPEDFSSRSTSALVKAMKREHVDRLVMITGAMIGPQQNLGWFYKGLTKIPAIQRTLPDRKLSEEIVLSSGLNVTLVRPPRLSDAPVTHRVETYGSTTIEMMDSMGRHDLAQTIVEVVEEEPTESTLYCRSKSDASFMKAWILRCGLAEFAGIGLAAAVAVGLHRLFSNPETFAARLTVYIVCLWVGALEGAWIGWAQGSLLRRVFPKLRVSRMMAWTAAVAVLAWAVGMFPSTFLQLQPPTPNAPPVEPPLLAVLGISAVGGALGGLLIAGAQWMELKRYAQQGWMWVGASTLGWAIALPLDMLGAVLPNAQTPSWLIITSGAGFGFLAGIAFSLPTGWLALHWRKQQHKGSLPNHR